MRRLAPETKWGDDPVINRRSRSASDIGSSPILAVDATAMAALRFEGGTDARARARTRKRDGTLEAETMRSLWIRSLEKGNEQSVRAKKEIEMNTESAINEVISKLGTLREPGDLDRGSIVQLVNELAYDIADLLENVEWREALYEFAGPLE